ncbi:MAG: DUF2779 domain-containing protein [Candidatus Aenigmarchaeota archaeon]|nr:DUF2779 domain-containing protein [Candidatus Aenigmarchaeota archaeon]
MALLTKSKYMNGLQCPRLLWFAHKKQLPEISVSDLHRFSQGHDFEEYVKPLFPDGVDLNGMGFKENIDRTKELIGERKTIFEAGMMVGNLFIRADIIRPTDDDKWDLYEIKSTTKVKPQHMPDLAFQKYVLEKAGLKIDRCFLIHLNNEYVRAGDIDPKGLIIQDEVTDDVNKVDGIETNAKEFHRIISMDTPPESCISKDCNKPYSCPLKPDCWKTLPENNVLQLTNWRVYWQLLDAGIKDIKDVPVGTKLTAKDEILMTAVNNGTPVVIKDKIKTFLDSLNYPLYHFDFETFDTAVPIFDRSRPYQKMAFQYSLHIEAEDGTTQHKEFLADGGCDPRPALLEQMKTDLDGTGDIIVFNKSFELSVMRKLAEDFPEHKTWLESAMKRVVDLADPFRSFYYYNPTQKGSYSIKKVLPAITGKGYSGMDISNGADASVLYFLTHIRPNGDNDNLPPKDKVRQDLIKYCCLDTEGMVWIIDGLKKLIG